VAGERRKGGHALRIGTPKGFNHCYDTFLDGKPGHEPDHKSWLYTSLQGGNVPPEEIEAAKRRMDPRTFRQEYDASFENYQGVVYYTFNREECRTAERIKPGEQLHIGMDFNVMKMSAVVYVIRDGLPLALDELHTVRDTPDMIERIQARFPGPRRYGLSGCQRPEHQQQECQRVGPVTAEEGRVHRHRGFD
jgi:hypothetical protein